MRTGNWCRTWVVAVCLPAAGPAAACPRCRALTRAAIADPEFVPRLCSVLLPVAVVAAVSILAHRLGAGPGPSRGK